MSLKPITQAMFQEKNTKTKKVVIDVNKFNNKYLVKTNFLNTNLFATMFNRYVMLQFKDSFYKGFVEIPKYNESFCVDKQLKKELFVFLTTVMDVEREEIYVGY